MRGSAPTAREAFPPRPYLPPMYAFIAGEAVGAALIVGIAWELFSASWELAPASVLPITVFAADIILLGISRVLGANAIASRLSLFLAGALVAGCASFIWAHQRASERAALSETPSTEVVFRIVSDPTLGSSGYSCLADVCDARGKRIACVSLVSSKHLERGAALHASVRTAELGSSSWAKSRYMKKAVASVRVVRMIEIEPLRICSIESAVLAFRARVLDLLKPADCDERALIAGIVCGYTSELSRSGSSDAISACGLSHMVAVSGSHLALISSFLALFLNRLQMKRAQRSLVLVGIDVLYVLFTGCAPSAIRSACMVACTTLSGFGHRRPHGLSALGVSVAILIACNPSLVYDLGFQLSCLSVLFILLFSAYIGHYLRSLTHGAAFSSELSCTLCAQAATLPLTVPLFGSISLISPVANMLLAPLMTALMCISLAACTLASLLPICQGALAVPVALARISLFLIQLIARVPYASVAVDPNVFILISPYILALCLYARWPKLRPASILRGAGALVLAFSLHRFYWTRFAPAEVIVLDVGQADSILIRDGSSAVLVDAGVDIEAAKSLSRNNVYALDAVIVTHWDADHCAGLDDVLQSVPVDAVYVASGAEDFMPSFIEGLSGSELQTLLVGDHLYIGNFEAQVVWPKSTVDGLDNEDSLCLAVEYQGDCGGLKMLLTGDSEKDQELQYADAVGDIDVLKLGHHGSKLSVNNALMECLKPELSIASAGEGNSYGHPSDECIETVESAGSRFLCTIQSGDIRIRPGRGGIDLSVQWSVIE